jgi:16S rRNA (uracil1498-N3)-methyltransferase
MKIHAFIASSGLDTELAAHSEGATVVVHDENLVRQWGSVLRFEVGEKIMLFYNDGLEALCSIQSLSRREAALQIEKKNPNQTASVLERRPVRAYVALLKGDRFEEVAQKLAEIGVSSLVPLVAERSIKRSANLERLTAIAKEASEQSMNARPMRIEPPMAMTDALADAAARCVGGVVAAHVPSLSSEGTATAAAVHVFEAWNKDIVGTRAIFVGPEGGFSDGEVGVLSRGTVRFVSLGPTVLRAETAAIACALAARDCAR